MGYDDCAKIMLLGRTGEGKSSFINYLLQSNVCKTSATEPCTMAFDCYDYELTNGMPIRIYDSRGLETKDFESIKDQLIEFISTRCKSENVFDWLHAIFYCKNLKRGRFEPEEFRMINELSKEITQTIHIIITNSPESETDELVAMKKHIQDNLGDHVRISCVNSVETKTRKGVTPTFGRRQILDSMFELLWSNISEKISGEYANEYRSAIIAYIEKLEGKLRSAVNDFNSLDIITKDVDEALGKFNNAFDQANEFQESLIKSLDKKYKVAISPLIDFYKNYKGLSNFNIRTIDLSAYFDLDIFESSDNSELMIEFEDLSDKLDGIGESFTRFLGMMAKATSILIRMKSLVKKYKDDIISAMYSQVPTVDHLQAQIYKSLMESLVINE